MPTTSNKGSGDAAILTRAVDTVFRKLIRFLVGRISLVRLQEMIRYIYVEEAERTLRADSPGKNVPMTKLALVTGLDTRTLVEVRKRLETENDRYRQQFLSELTPESAIVEAWAGLDGGPGEEKSRVLEYGSEQSGFEQLVKSTLSSRGITTQSIIERLVATRSVAQDRENRTLRLLVDEYSPYLSDDEPNIVNAALSAISNLVSTIEHNMACGPDEKFFQRQSWTFRLDPADRDPFRLAMRKLLAQYRAGAETGIKPWERETYGGNLLTAGVGFYYFEDA